MTTLKYWLYQMLPDALNRYFFGFVTLALFRLKKSRISNVVLYGAGDLGAESFVQLRRAGISVEMWVDLKAKQEAFSLFDFPIESTARLAQISAQTAVLICSQATIKPMYNECVKQGVLESNIVVVD